MLSDSLTQLQSSALNFSMKTSSRDKINLSTYSNQSLSHSNDSGSASIELSLRERYGYSFSYHGDSISEADKKEINKALKNLKPTLSFLNPNTNFQKSDKNISDKAMDINALLPKSEDSNMTNYIKDSLITMMDEMNKAFKANDEMLTLARDVFDQLDKQMKGLNLYA
jgi:hypothetical protein